MGRGNWHHGTVGLGLVVLPDVCIHDLQRRFHDLPHDVMTPTISNSHHNSPGII